MIVLNYEVPVGLIFYQALVLLLFFHCFCFSSTLQPGLFRNPTISVFFSINRRVLLLLCAYFLNRTWFIFV